MIDEVADSGSWCDVRHRGRQRVALNLAGMEESMGILIDIMGLLAMLANGLFALHIWSAVSARAMPPMRRR